MTVRPFDVERNMSVLGRLEEKRLLPLEGGDQFLFHRARVRDRIFAATSFAVEELSSSVVDLAHQRGETGLDALDVCDHVAALGGGDDFVEGDVALGDVEGVERVDGDETEGEDVQGGERACETEVEA